MKTSIDGVGRVLVPAALRRRAGLEAGVELDARFEDGKLVLEPSPLSVQIQKRGRFYVAQPQADVPAMTSDDVAAELGDLQVTAPRGTAAAAPKQAKKRAKPRAKKKARRK